MLDQEPLAEVFEAHRGRLRSIAHRMLGASGEADDAVQETWLRLRRADAADIENLGAWLTTVVSRVSLDILRSRSSRPEIPDDEASSDRIEAAAPDDPEDEVLLGDSVGRALLVMLDTLTPSERLAFVLHDTFGVPFGEVGAVLGRSAAAAKQVAYRARHKVRGADSGAEVDRHRQLEVVDAFLAASRNGNFEALLALLDPAIVLDADAAAAEMGAPESVRGASEVAAIFSGRALGAQAALLDGAVGLVWMVAERPKVAWDFSIRDGKIVHIDMLAAPETLDRLDLETLKDAG